jgi:uncharacterized protein (TIGR03435 family)
MQKARLFLLLLPLTGLPLRQTAAPAPSFEVTSVKPNHNPPVSTTGARVVSLRLSLNHGMLTFEQLSLTNLLLQAYDIQRNQIVGCPGWCDSEFFDVVGKAENSDVTPDQVRLMLQTLLADRFRLAVRREKQERSGYALTVGKNGMKLKAAGADETTGASASGYIRTFQRLPIAALVNFLANSARQPVFDETGLKGLFDFTLDLTPRADDPLQAAVRNGVPLAADPTNGFSRIAEAVENQLGLRLESRRIPTEMLIIDHVEHPSEN